MFHKILAAIDTSAIAKYVFEQALTLAKADNANLMLFHVISEEGEGSRSMPILPRLEYYPVVSDKTLEIYREQWEVLEKQGLDLLRSHTAQATAAGVSTEFTQGAGSPGRKICDLARSWNADLIIMGRRGRSGLSELILGSVSNYVLHHAGCSVLVVQHPVKVDNKAVELEPFTKTLPES